MTKSKHQSRLIDKTIDKLSFSNKVRENTFKDYLSVYGYLMIWSINTLSEKDLTHAPYREAAD